MPNNLEAEQSLLGCMLMDNEILTEVAGGLQREDFYQESHQIIMGAIKELFSEHKPTDIVTLSDKLENAGELDDIGGISYITELAQITPSTANYKYYFDIVKRDSLNRSMIRAAREIIENASKSEDVAASIQFAESKIYAVSQTQDSSAIEDVRAVGFYDVMDRFNMMEANKGALRGVQTGFFRLDKLTNGLQKSDLIVLAARPGMGKTSLAMNIVEHAAVYGGKVCAVFSLEMPKIQIKERLMCGVAGVSMSVARSGKLSDDDWKRIAKANTELNKSPLYIDDSARVTPAEILSKCRRIKSKNSGKLDLVMIDYIQLMSSGKHRSGEENRTQEVAAITRELKLMAKELDVPVIALSQLRRIQSGEPQLSDLRESGAIEQDADIVMFINRPDVGVSEEELKSKQITKGSAILNVAKHRNGELARLPLRFKGELVKFIDAEIEG